MIKQFLILFSLFVSIGATAQLDSLPSDKDLGRQHINELRNGGALVVRLKARTKTISAYLSSGNKSVADRIHEEDTKLNKKIVEAFVNEFRFCPVYFIYANASRQLINDGKAEFLNSQLQVDTSIHLKTENFLLLDYGTSMLNESTNSYNYTYGHTTEGSTPGNSQAFTILDKQYSQLHSPFPYIVYLNPLEHNAFSKAVTRLNTKLFTYYAQTNKKKN
ncbi:MAG: hypothetical protein M9931_08895 [Chitinophagales bacterium]|nr:hypothetical protein [Chitinophagales bacterium]OJV30813.1 MAG: hypothetical protein BGO32_09975 [Bacteroidetes bacterium 37-13]HRN93616.1 hypothetical protein [Chitinophagales bacterium]HRP39145.1 hypothetical protein [Chitinophagales bacterium]